MPNAVTPFKIGSFDCFAIRDGDDWTGNILLVKTGEHHILIDTGLGPDWQPTPALLLGRLEAANSSAAAIDSVILSHADWDHIAGAVLASGELAFPNARYFLHRQEWEFWASKPERHPPSDAYDEDFRRRARTFPPTRLAQLRPHLEMAYHIPFPGLGYVLQRGRGWRWESFQPAQ